MSHAQEMKMLTERRRMLASVLADGAEPETQVEFDATCARIRDLVRIKKGKANG